MEQTVNVNEAVANENQGTAAVVNEGVNASESTDIKTDQPTFEELSAAHQQENNVPENQAEGSENIEDTVQQPEFPSELLSELPSELKPEEIIPEEPELTPEENIINNWLQNGKTEVSTNELMSAGFNVDEMHPQTNTIGRFKLSRILLISPFRIEKVNK